MTRKLAALTLAAFLLMAGVAGANKIPVDDIHISCTEISFDWTNFPAHSVILHATVTQGDQLITASVDTEGEPAGTGHVPLTFTGSGPVSATVTWTLGETQHQSGPVVAELDCTPATVPTTSPPTTAPPTTVAPTTVALGPPVSIVPRAPQLAYTGASHTALLAFAGWLFIGFGAALIFGARMRSGDAE